MSTKPQIKPTPDLAAFRKLDTGAQLKALRGTKVERSFQVQRDGNIDEAKRTVWAAASSEEPYERWWGVEILDHSAKSIRTERLKSGLAVLVGHDTANHIGIVDDFEIAPDRRLRTLSRFGRGVQAEEKFRDIVDGILVHMSVGYIIHDLVLEKSVDGVNTYRVTDWEPIEVSWVPIPADYTVGTGKNLDLLENKPEPQPDQRKTMTPEEKAQLEAQIRAKIEAEMKDKADAEARARANDPLAVQARETERVNAILACGDEFAATGGAAIARELIKDPKATVETFKSRMLDAQRGSKPMPTAEPGGQAQFGSGARHLVLRGRKLRSFTQPLVFSDGSKMEAEECAYRSAQWMLATVGNNQRAAKWCSERGIDVSTRVMTTDVGTAGGYLVPDEMEQSIIDLRESYGLARRLARRRPMATDTKSIPKRTGGVTAYFINEDNSGVTASDKGWGNVNLVAKTLAALSLISMNLEEDAAIDVVDDLAQEQAYAFALKEDQCWLIGDGTSTYGGMTGLITLMEATAYASRIAATTNHDTFAEIDNTDLTSVMGGVADYAGINPVWLSSKLFQNLVMNRLKATAGGNNVQTLQGRPQDNYLGYDSYSSEIMPKVTTTLVNKVMALYGDFSLSSSFGDRRGIMVQVLRERYAEKLQIGILGSERFQIVNHDLGTTSVKGPVAALYGA